MYYGNSIITGIFTLLSAIIGVLLGFALNCIYQHNCQRKLVKKEFQHRKLRIIKTSETTYLTVVLRDFREFLFRNPQLLEKKAFNDFYDKWITPYEPYIEVGQPVNIPSLNEGRKEMESDLEELKI